MAPLPGIGLLILTYFSLILYYTFIFSYFYPTLFIIFVFILMDAFNSIAIYLYGMCKSLKHKPYHNICKLCPCLLNIIKPSQLYNGIINPNLRLLGSMFIQHLGLTKSYKESLDLSSREFFLIFSKARDYAQKSCSGYF